MPKPLKLLAEQLLLGCPTYEHETVLPTYIPGEATLKRWVFRPEVRVPGSPSVPAKPVATCQGPLPAPAAASGSAPVAGRVNIPAC